MRAALLLAVGVAPLMAASDWLKFTSSNFEMFTTAGVKDGRRTIEYFEQVRDFFMRIKSQQVTTRLPVTIVAFKNAKEYRPYTMRETAVAYFTGDEQRDYIVMSGVGNEHYPVAVHEYMHLLVRHSGLKLPIWLNEGMAEVYSTLKPLGGEVLLGLVPEGRIPALHQFKWIPLDRFLSITHESPEFDEKNRTSLLYSQSWLLTHMLMLSEPYAAKFPDFTLALSNGASSQVAFQKVYGKDLMQINADLQSYFRGNSLNGIRFKTKLQKMEVPEPTPAPEFETELTLTKLVALMGRKTEAAGRYSQLAQANPDRWEVHEAIAHVYWRSGDFEKTKASFLRAVELNSPNWKTYWDFARVAHDHPKAIDALKRTLELNPTLVDARIQLGFEYNNREKYQEAYDALAPIRQISPDRAASLFLAKAYAAMRIGKKAEAKSAAEMAKKHATKPTEALQAQQWLDYLDRPEPEKVMARAYNPEAPAVPSASSSSTFSGGQPEVQTIRGALQEVECIGPEARITVTSGTSQFPLLVRDPTTVRIQNSDSSTVELQCGLQKGARVVVGVIVKDDAKFKTKGDVVTLEFQ